MDHDSSLQDLVPITRQNLTRGVLIDHYEHVDHDYDYLPRGVLMWSAPPASSLLYFMFVYSRPTCDDHDNDDDDYDHDHDHDAGEMVRSHMTQ